jgi:hypothetical protein
MTDREAMKMALAKFEHLWDIGIDAEYKVELLPEIEVLRQALAQPDKPLRLSPVYEYGHIHEASQPEQDKLLVDLIQEQRAEIDRLRQALAQPEQEPVKCTCGYAIGHPLVSKCICTPPKPWVGLTDEEISELYYLSGYGSKEYDGGANSFARAIEAKLKEKNI